MVRQAKHSLNWRDMFEATGLSRRSFLAGLAAAGTSAGILEGRLFGQANSGKPRLINVHHHLTAPAYVKFLTENKVREFPAKSAPRGSKTWTRQALPLPTARQSVRVSGSATCPQRAGWRARSMT